MTDDNKTDKVAAERRRFLENCGRFAAVTPPTVALMLSAPGSVRAALAASGAPTTGTATVTTTATTTTSTTATSTFTTVTSSTTVDAS